MTLPRIDLDLCIVALLSLILGFAGIDKLFHFEGFINALRNYVLMPRGWAAFAAMPLILIEIALAIALWVKAWRRPALLVTAGLFVLFTVALVGNLLYGDRGICGCWFTFTLAQSNTMHIAQNVMLASLAFMVWQDAKPPVEAAANEDVEMPEATPFEG